MTSVKLITNAKDSAQMNRKMPRMIRCCVSECWRKSTDPEKLTFHRFPCDLDLCRKWLQKAGDKELTWLPEEFLTKSRYVCSIHFPQSSYRPGTNCLKAGSVPSVFEKPVEPLTEEDVMVYPLKSKNTVKRMKKNTTKSLQTNEDKDKNQNKEVSNSSREGDGTSEVVCNSPTFMEYLNTETEDSGQGELQEVTGFETAEVAEKSQLSELEAGGSEAGPKDGSQETILLPESLHYSFTITENLDIRLDVTDKSVEPEPPRDLEFWKSRAEKLQEENTMLTSKVASMQLVIDSLQKELESRKSLNLGGTGNQCYFIDLTSAMAPISL